MSNKPDRILKLYLDTSVPNFLFAEDAKEKQKITEKLFHSDIRKQYKFYISGVVIREIEKAPLTKREHLMDVLKNVEIIEFTEEAERLAEAYLFKGALPKTSDEDARHVAIATVSNMDAVVSWNFKHLVNLRRIKSVNLVNEEMGYKHIEIISPEEVVNL